MRGIWVRRTGTVRREWVDGGGLDTLMNVIPTTRPRFGGDLLKVSMETISASTGRGQSARQAEPYICNHGDP